MNDALKVENLKYKNILNGITFSLKENSFNVLIGSNGSGKTTLVNSLRGLIKYEGNISIFNNSVENESYFNINKEIGFFINEQILLENNVFEELKKLLININYTETESKKRIYDVAKKLDIIELLFREKTKLTNAEKTLISFVFSIIHNPKILVIDNELSNLNKENVNKIINYIKKQSKLTILLITTNKEFLPLASNILLLKEGKIVLNCKYEEIVDNEKTFVKNSVGLPFCISLSNKLISYELIQKVHYDIEKLVNDIWQ